MYTFFVYNAIGVEKKHTRKLNTTSSPINDPLVLAHELMSSLRKQPTFRDPFSGWKPSAVFSG